MTNGNPPPATSAGDNVVAIVAIVILVGLAILFFVYALPALQGTEVEETMRTEQDRINIDVRTPPLAQPPQPTPAPTPTPAPAPGSPQY